MVFPNFEKVGSAALICDSYCFMFLKFAFSHKELRLTYMFSTIALEGILCILNFKDHLFVYEIELMLKKVNNNKTF